MFINIDKYLSDTTIIKDTHRDKKFDKIYKIHKYWARKPWHIVEKNILDNSNPRDIVLDPFIGSGMTGLESLLNNRRIIGYDLNPFACFLSKATIDNIDFDSTKFSFELEKIQSFVIDHIMPLYYLKNHNKYILYWVSGSKGPSDYNTIITDQKFKERTKITVSKNILEKSYKLKYEIPNKKFPKAFYKDRFSYKGYTEVADFYSSRNLYALSSLYNYIVSTEFYYKDLFYLAFSNTLLHTSVLKGINVRPLSVNNYWIPDDHIQENVAWRYLDRLKNVHNAKEAIKTKWISKGKSNKLNYKIYNKSSVNLSDINDKSIDYIFTDPPYGDAIQYSELSFIWNTWLNKDFKIDEEVIINPKQNKFDEDYLMLIQKFITNCYRVLKNNKKFTLCFQNKNINIWYSILKYIKNAGFNLSKIEINYTQGSSFNKNWAKFSPKNDVYITFVKEEKVIKSNSEHLIENQFLQQTIVKKINNDKLNLSKSEIFDLYVISIINLLFDGYVISDQKLDLKSISKAFLELETINAIK